MKSRAIYYFDPQDYVACKELRQAYLSEVDGDSHRAILAICIDMVALDAYLTDLEQWVASQGMDIAMVSAMRPCSPRSPCLRLLSESELRSGSSKCLPEPEWVDELRRRLQAWTGRWPSSVR